MRSTRRALSSTFLLLAALFAVPALIDARTIRPDDITISGNFSISAAVTGLAAPTMVAFDDESRMLIAESGYDSAGQAKLSRVEPDGTRTTLFEVPQNEVPLTSVAVNDGATYFVTATTVWTMTADGEATPLITGLPGLGDHQPNQLAFLGDRLYLAIGTVTNSSVVGPDNAIFGWLKLPERRDLHDVPCEDVTLATDGFVSDDPLAGGTTTTSPYSPLGTALPVGTTIPGEVPCNGAVLSANLDGTDLRVEALGLRNPYGLRPGPDGNLYLTMHGDDARGSRQVENAPDCFYRLEPGAWYGWPDFACDVPVTDPQFKPANQPQPGFVVANHPTDSPPVPIAKFDPHAAANGFSFSPGDPWGAATDAFVALFGDATPATGTVDRPEGVAVVRVDITTGDQTPFITNVIPGEASEHLLGGIEHPSDVTFGPDGNMYMTDWGVFRDTLDGLQIEPLSGVVWRIVPTAERTGSGISSGVLLNAALLGLFGVVTLLLGAGRRRVLSLPRAAAVGAVAGAAMGLFAMFVTAPLLQLPWFGAPRLMATIVMGRDAVQNIVEFEPVSFVVGAVVLLAMGLALGIVYSLIARTRNRVRLFLTAVAFSVTVWAALQWFVLPALFPLISDKGLPPAWLAATFLVFGAVLALLAVFSVSRTSLRPQRPSESGANPNNSA